MAKLPVAIVGAGIGKYHVMAALDHPGVELVGVADLNPDKGAALRRALADAGYGEAFPFYTDVAAMYEVAKPAAVSLCTPNHTHKGLFCDALDRGLHVLCEKPLADNYNAAREMALTAAQCTGQVAVMQSNNLFRTIIRQLKEASDSIGNTKQYVAEWLRPHGLPLPKTWFSEKAKSGGGPLVDLAPHVFGVVQHLAGWKKRGAVMCSTYGMADVPEGWVGPYADGFIGDGIFDVETVADGIFLLGDERVPFNFRVSWAEPTDSELLRIKRIGDKGAVEAVCVWDEVDKDATATKQLVYIGAECDAKHNCIASMLADTEELSVGDQTNGRIENVKAFYDKCLGVDDGAPLVNIDQGLIVQAMINAAYASADCRTLFAYDAAA